MLSFLTFKVIRVMTKLVTVIVVYVLAYVLFHLST